MAIDLESIWHHALAEVSGRNLGIELSVQTDAQEPAVQPYHARVLHVEGHAGKSVVLQRVFARVGEPSYFHVGRRFNLVLTSDGSRYTASYELTVLSPFDLGPERRVMGMRMQRVGPVRSAQRRNSFRVDTAALDITVSMRLLERNSYEQPHATGIQLLNLSAHGLAIQVRSDLIGPDSPKGETIEVTLTAPSWPAPLLLVGKVARYDPIKSGYVLLGVEVIFPDTKDGRHLRDHLLKLTTELQREYLRRISGNL